MITARAPIIAKIEIALFLKFFILILFIDYVDFKILNNEINILIKIKSLKFTFYNKNQSNSSKFIEGLRRTQVLL
tara:strand:- start:40 stop:264 length:225 start_codon:yes stop_codon:yes gene_type:complete